MREKPLPVSYPPSGGHPPRLLAALHHKCSRCGSAELRRSRRPAGDRSIGHLLLSPYRCKDCNAQLWLVGGRVHRLGMVFVVIAVTVAFTVMLLADRPLQLETGTDSPDDAGKAAATIERAKRGDGGAEYELSRMYAAGRGVQPSNRERWVWLKRAAEHGNVDAQYEIGIALRYGRGVIQDYEHAAKWLERAAQGGSPLAQFELGQMYRGNAGIGIDNVKAYIWLNLAAAQGVSGADTARDAVLHKLSLPEITQAQAEARRMSEVAAKPVPSVQ